MLKSNRIRALVCDKNKIIFLWTPKSGCTTAKYIFYDFIGVNIPINDIMFVHNAKLKKLGHVKNKFPKNFKEYLKIQFVRNPYEKAISGFLTHIQHKKFNKCDIIENLNLNNFLKKIKNQSLIDCRSCFFHNQLQLVTKHIDEIIKIENLSNSLEQINKKYNIKLKDLSYEKHSHRKQIEGHYKDFLSIKNVNLINQLYWRDINFFKYKKLGTI